MGDLFRGLSRLVLFWVLFMYFDPKQIEAEEKHYKWEVKYAFKAPDCYTKLAITINGLSPGPTIDARLGDTIVIELTNRLFLENVLIHWHGIRQYGTPWMDGTEGVTQCPILPGETFVYRYKLDRPGTYLYHGHYGLQKSDGLNGMIWVRLPKGKSEPYSYDVEQGILLTDWYHQTSSQQAVGLSSIPFAWVKEPQGKFNCSTPGIATALCNATSTDCVPYILTVEPGKTYRLRIGSLTSLSALSFEIEGHNLTVVEADGSYVEPFTVQNLYIYSGETYSVLIKADQEPSRNYWILTKVVSRNSTTPPGLAILNYAPTGITPPPSTPPQGPLWNDVASRVSQSKQFKALSGHFGAPPLKADRTIVFLNTQNLINGYVRWSINNISFRFPETPYLIAYKKKLAHTFDRSPPPSNYDSSAYDIFSVAKNVIATTRTGIFRLKFGSVIDIILQNANTMTPNNSETHPWHLHGHHFWVLGYGNGKFDMEKDPEKFNSVNPIMKNTVALHPYGWTAIRFVADNPGVWAFHCHIEYHFFLGMFTVLEEGIDRVEKLPDSIMGCVTPKRKKEDNY